MAQAICMLAVGSDQLCPRLATAAHCSRPMQLADPLVLAALPRCRHGEGMGGMHSCTQLTTAYASNT
jgi:hypothetical protein